MKRNQGFTLVEIAIVLVIVVIVLVTGKKSDVTLAEGIADNAGQRIGCSASRIGNDDLDRLGWKILSGRRSGSCKAEQRRDTGRKQTGAGSLHDASPGIRSERSRVVAPPPK